MGKSLPIVFRSDFKYKQSRAVHVDVSCPRIPNPHFLCMIHTKVFKQLWTFRTFGASGVQVLFASILSYESRFLWYKCELLEDGANDANVYFGGRTCPVSCIGQVFHVFDLLWIFLSFFVCRYVQYKHSFSILVKFHQQSGELLWWWFQVFY